MISRINFLKIVKVTSVLGCCLMFLSFGCVTQNNESNNSVEPVSIALQGEETFDIDLQLDELKDGKYNLGVTIKLDGESYVVSPYSEDSIYGHFNISIPETAHFVIENDLLEIPNSVREFDPIIEMPVNFVRENTTYRQQIKVLSKDDFEVTGVIWFLLEPICIPYEVEFVLSHRSGKMEVKKTKTGIDRKTYKQ